MAERDVRVERGRSWAAPLPAGPALGVVFVGGFLVLANANAVLSGNLLQRLHPLTFLFWSFLTAAVFFGVLLVARHGVRALRVGAGSARPLLMLNVTTAVLWIGYYYALRFIEPAIVSALIGGLGPLSTIGLERLVRRRRLPPRAYLAATGILSGAVLLAWASLAGLSGLRELSATGAAIGLAAATVGGVSQALTTVASKQLGDHGWTATRIMAHRFHLLVVVAAVLAWTGPGLAVADPSQQLLVAVATVLGVIAPLWLLQRGILLCEPFTVAALLALAPVLTYLFQGFDARMQWSVASALGCLVVAAFTIYSTRTTSGGNAP
jgi:drug/metabolite transporter (DMT)-like permease